jgi:hypothetical protein
MHAQLTNATTSFTSAKQAQHNVEKNYQRDEWTSIASAKGNRRMKPCETIRLST